MVVNKSTLHQSDQLSDHPVKNSKVGAARAKPKMAVTLRQASILPRMNALSCKTRYLDEIAVVMLSLN